ncbi:putative pentatricopeptide repeat-containing protein At3g01580 [Chenopodium quinoa]|uniref:putative pentatricopeptide repeat-containing protein At3g01580 n=1 Tax=Chenopodium quinoa TaxID=63459 RepID=UPI000B79262C|nr:putative pentatricopeptide repeat-containing protein At3g01580 [Chenopodium quinoa]
MVTTITQCNVFVPQSHHYVDFNRHHFVLEQCKFFNGYRRISHASIYCNSKFNHTAITHQNQCSSFLGSHTEHNLTRNKGLINESSVDELIKEFTYEGFYVDAVKLYIGMLDGGFIPNVFYSFPVLVKAIGGVCDLNLTRQVHGHILKLGVIKYISVANSLLSTFWKCGASDDAIRMFKTMQERDSVSWSTMISGFHQSRLYISSLEWFAHMVCEFGIYPNRVACISALSSCTSVKSLIHGEEIHAFVIKSGLDVDEFVLSGLLEFYMKCSVVSYAEQLFQSVVGSMRKNTVLWNVMILGYVENSCYSQALCSFIEMMVSGVKFDSSTMVAILALCSESLNLAFGKQIHALIIKTGLEIDVRVGTSLIDMYFNCGQPDSGLHLFDRFHNHNIVMWGTVITNCVRCGSSRKALDLFVVGLEHGYLDLVMLLAALRACSSLTVKLEGMLLHGMAVKMGLDLDTYIGSALVDMYMKCQNVPCAQKVFLMLPTKDEVVWSSLISGYTHNECLDDAVRAFCKMQDCRIRPNAVIMSCLLSICTQLYTNLKCKEIHGYLIRSGFEANILVNNSLVVAYARCGNLESSWRVFIGMKERDKVSWNSMMLGLSLHGLVDEMLVLFDQMRKNGLKPDHQTFTAILSACSHTGRVADGLKFFRSMTEEHMLEPKLEQYTCLVDLLGRAGYVNQAYDLIIAMPHIPDDRIWGSLLGSCKIHGNEKLAEVVANHIFELNPDSIGYRVLLANLFEDLDKWNEVVTLRSKIKGMVLKKSPGCSWIDVNNQIHVFTASDQKHDKVGDIYAMLKNLTAEIIRDGYIPQV